MKTLQNAVLLAAAVVAAASAQTQPVTPPAPPACLSGPVTVGNVTLACSMIDATGGADNLITASGGYLFGVKATSSDPTVNAIQAQLTILQSTDPNASSPTAKRTVTLIKGASGAFAYAFYLNPTSDGQGNLSVTAITGITIQELKPSSSQSF